MEDAGGWKYQNYLLVQGQIKGHNVLIQRKFSCPKEQISLNLSVLKQFSLSKTV